MIEPQLRDLSLSRPSHIRALEHDLADLRQDFEQLLVAHRALRSRVYALEGELRNLRNYVDQLESYPAKRRNG